MSDFSAWVKQNRMGLVVGALATTVTGSLLMVLKGEQKREEDFEADGQHPYTKGDAHPHPHPATELLAVHEISGVSQQVSENTR